MVCDNDEANTVDFRSSDCSHDAKLSLMSHTIETLIGCFLHNHYCLLTNCVE